MFAPMEMIHKAMIGLFISKKATMIIMRSTRVSSPTLAVKPSD